MRLCKCYDEIRRDVTRACRNVVAFFFFFFFFYDAL